MVRKNLDKPLFLVGIRHNTKLHMSTATRWLVLAAGCLLCLPTSTAWSRQVARENSASAAGGGVRASVDRSTPMVTTEALT